MKTDSWLSWITVAISLVFACIAALIGVAALLRARVNANEAEVIGDTREIVSAERAYASANCGFYDDLTRLCRDGTDCAGIAIPEYDGPDFLGGELGRNSPYVKSGYERTWTPLGPQGEVPPGCSPTATSVPNYCYQSVPVDPLSGARSYSATADGKMVQDPTGQPILCPPSAFLCIVEGTLVETPGGAVAIEKLDIGDAVRSVGAYHENTVNRVVAKRHSKVDRYLRIHFASGHPLELTDTHPVSTPTGWQTAGTLDAGDVVDGQDGRVTIVRIEQVHDAVVVYDITVEPDACFFANGILVHNKSE